MRAAIAILVGCSSSSPAPAPAPPPKPRPISSFSPDEQTKLCQDITAYRKATAALPGATRVRCATQALGAAGAPDNTTPEAMRAACKQELADCLVAPTPPETIECTTLMTQLARCGDLTAEEMTACTEEMRGMMTTVANDDPCAAPLDPADPLASFTAFTGKMKGPKCAVVDTKCKSRR